MRIKSIKMRNSAPWKSLWLCSLLASVLACTAPNKDYCLSGYCPDPDDEREASGDDLGERPRDRDLGGGSDLDMRGAAAPDPGLPGPYKTVQFDLIIQVTGGYAQVTVIGPTENGITLSLRGAPFPLVLFAPNTYADRKAYASYGQRLASHGIITALQKAPNERDYTRYRDNTIELLNWLLHPSGTSADRVKDRLDEKRVGMAGHSGGGKVGILVAGQDRRVKGYLGIDPLDIGSPSAQEQAAKLQFPSGVPIGLLGETVSKTGRMGQQPCTPPDTNYEALYAKAASPAFAITFAGAAHNDFTDGCTSLCTACPGATAPRDRTNRLAVKYVTAYFLWALNGQSAAADYLSGSEFQKDVAAGYVTRVAK